jgi:hypothetical protein
VKFSEYYINRRMPTRRITLAQAIDVVNNPVHILQQDDGRTRYWGFVAEFQRYIWVVVDPDSITIITAFVDSNFRP